MLVFPPPFKRKCHPKCAKQILNFTFRPQRALLETGLRWNQGKFLWDCLAIAVSEGSMPMLAALPTHTLMSLDFIPMSANLCIYVSIPFSWHGRKNGTSTWAKTPSRGAYTECRPRAPCLREGDSRLAASDHYTKRVSIFPNFPEQRCDEREGWVREEPPLSLGHLTQCCWEGFCPFTKTVSNNWAKRFIQLCLGQPGEFYVPQSLLVLTYTLITPCTWRNVVTGNLPWCQSWTVLAKSICFPHKF